jgi:hypothetical protein
LAATLNGTTVGLGRVLARARTFEIATNALPGPYGTNNKTHN